MKIVYSHLSQYILEKPTIQQISDSLFQLGHEHEIDGDIFDMEFTPNRGDCLSLNGLLRDLAVFYTIDLNQDIYMEKIQDLQINFENHSTNICPQISFLKIEIEQVPGAYKNNLENYFKDLSVNKNNFFTDISNYLSYETGQPTHCYDADTIKGTLLFKEINEDKDFNTLLDKKIKLTGKNSIFLLNNEVINLAGVVGGKSSSCSEDTKTVIVECAYFKPEAIIGKSIKYGIQSEAAYKFERGVDPNCQDKVLRRFIKLVSENTKIKNLSIISHSYDDSTIHQIPINVNKINQIIGTDINESEYLNYVIKLGFVIDEGFIKVPSFRNDVKTQNDLAEEVARTIGYDNIPRAHINIPKSEKLIHNCVENKLRYFLLDNGFYEVINSPFIGQKSKTSIKVDNPLDSNREYLRTNITDSLLDNLLYNEKRQKDSIKLFEISDIYMNGMQKKRMLSVIASGKVGLNYEDFSKKINLDYLTKLFQKISLNNSFDFKQISRDTLNTKIKTEIISVEIDIDSFSNEILSYEEISRPPQTFVQYNSISEQPSSFKDISYAIHDYSKTKSLQEFLLNYDNSIIKDIFIFDYFFNEKKHEIKIGFRFVFQSKSKTLTSSDIDIVYADILEKSASIEGVSIPGI